MSALKYALWLVGKRDYPVFGMREKLNGKEYSKEEVEETIDKLIKLKFLDDERFTRSYIESQRRIKPIGNRLLYQKLILKGIDKEIINSILSAPDEELIREAADKWLKRHPISDKWVRKQKLMAYLSRRGFSYDEILKALEELKN